MIKWFMLFLASTLAQNMTPGGLQCTLLPRGLSGSWTGTTVGASGGIGGSCSGVTYNAMTGENLLIVSVPGFATPGGMLTLDTCNGTTWDTELIVSGALAGGRCPSPGTAASFTCAAANDDACGMQSRVTIPASPGSSYAVLVTGFGSSSGPYTLTWSYSISSSNQVSTQITRSNTPSSRPSPSNSFTSNPSVSPTPSGTAPQPSASSTSTGTPTSSWSSSMTTSPSLAASVTSSTSMTPSSAPSMSSSFTMRASESSSPSMEESPSISDTQTGSSSASNTRSASQSFTSYPTRTPLMPIAAAAPQTTEISSMSITIGILVGVFLTVVVIGVWHGINNRNKQRRSVHLSPNIYFGNPPQSESVKEIQNASFRVQKRVDFDPTPTA